LADWRINRCCQPPATVVDGSAQDKPLATVVVDSTQDKYHRAGRGVQHAQQKPAIGETVVTDDTGAVQHSVAPLMSSSSITAAISSPKHYSVIKIEHCS
jgi:hypothetical protein